MPKVKFAVVVQNEDFDTISVYGPEQVAPARQEGETFRGEAEFSEELWQKIEIAYEEAKQGKEVEIDWLCKWELSCLFLSRMNFCQYIEVTCGKAGPVLTVAY